MLKDYVNHELVPILTMDPNGSRLGLAQTQPAPVYANQTDNTLSSPLLDGQIKPGVYTLAEETELELQAVHTETQVERV